jgi:hypothetical protein
MGRTQTLDGRPFAVWGAPQTPVRRRFPADFAPFYAQSGQKTVENDKKAGF